MKKILVEKCEVHVESVVQSVELFHTLHHTFYILI